MKKNIVKLAGICLMASLMLPMASCKSSQGAPANKGEEVLELYCSDGCSTNAKAFRYFAVGESMDMMTAKNKAMTAARAGLAAAVNATVKTVTDSYAKSGNYEGKEEFLGKFETMTREVVNLQLQGTSVTCEKLTKDASGTYKAYVCLEYGSSELFQALNNRASSDEMIKVDYNYEKFKNTFEEEMSKFNN